MQKTVRLDTREQRKRLPPRHEPYYVDVAKGVAVGYRRGVTAASWYLRRFNGNKYHKRELGQADDDVPADGVRVLAWPDVVKLAIVEPARADAYSAKYSVHQSVADYFEHRRARGRSGESVKIDEGKVGAFLEKFADTQVSALTTRDLQSWRDRLVSQPAVNADITETKRRDMLRASQATANRIWAICRAALNHAFRTGRVDTDLAWRRIQPFQDVDEARKRFLSIVEANKLLGACKGPFRDLVQAALLTGLRPGELVRLTVGQFQETRLEVSAGKTGKSRFVPLTTQGVALFKKLAKGRPPDALMLPNAEMKSWSRMQIARAMRAAVTAAQLETSAQFYDLRRSYGSLLANAQANDATIAHALGHADTRMTRRHYAHLLDSVVAAELQAKLPTFKARRSRKGTAGGRSQNGAASDGGVVS
ncbi:MAG: tyrosine-type recombinase/integrase [Steroidobacteraceae bacterium]